MSELKAHRFWDLDEIRRTDAIVGSLYYLKSEADKVIAEKDAEIAQLQAMLEERNKQVAELKSDIADLRDDKKLTDAILDERNAEIAELKEERRWRKFPEEKPESEGDYLVMARYPDDDEPHVETCFYDLNCEDFGHYERRYSFGGFDGEEWLTHNVSFWMPLPKAPEEAK